MNLLRIAILNINYIRGLFPENYFNDKFVPALVMKIKDLMPMDAESRRMIDWMDGGVSDALQKKYLKTLLFCVCETVGGPMIEECAFSFSYSNSESQEVSLNVNRIGNKRQGGTFSSTEITPNQMRSSVCKIRALIRLTGTLDEMPEERTILMKLLYYDDVTPVDYEPQCFRGCTEEEVNNPWTKNPLKMVVGNVNSKHLVFALEVKSVLNPSRDDSDVIQDVDVSLGEGDASDLKTKPAASRESFAQVMENGRTNGNGSFKGESSSQSKRSRKASAVRGRPYMDLILYSNKNNRDSLFEVFTNVSNDDSVFNTTKGTYPDEVYGMFICKDRVSAKTCKNCVTAAITQILVKCPLNNDAIIWFDNCFIQYSNKTTFSSLEKHPSFTTSAENDPYVCMSNQDQSSDQPSWFKEELLAKLDLITFKATSDPSNRMYAADIIETGLANFSGTVQCKSDLPEKDCFDCVSEAADRVKYCLPGKSEGIILTPNCSTRYELNPSHQSPCESKATACPCERRKREKIKDRDQCKCIRICIDGSAGILFVLLLLHKK